MGLLRELLLAQPVEHVELLAADLVGRVAAARQLDGHDDLPVGHHHRHAAEERLEVLGQLLPAGVARVHRDEEADILVKVDLVPVREDKAQLLLLDGAKHAGHLLRRHGEHLEVDPVELVEAAPAARHGEALVDAAERAVVHLVGAVGHDAVLAERARHVLDGLRLARAGGAGGRAAEEHAERLRERDVAAVGERRDDEPVLDAEVLARVLEAHVGHGDLALVEVGAVVEARLLLPLEVLGVLDAPLDDVLPHVALVDVDEDHRLDLLARPLTEGAQLQVGAQVDADEVVEALVVLLVGDLHDALLRLGAVECVLGVHGPLELDAEQRHLRLVLVRELLEAHDLAVARGAGVDPVDGALHLLEQPVEPLLDVALGLDHVAQPDLLPLVGDDRRDVRLLLLVELDEHDAVEDGLQVRLDGLRVGALREDLEERRVGHEEEAREGGALLVEVARERLLAELELLEHVGQQLLEAVVAVNVLDGDGLLVALGHDLDPVLVDGLEALALLRQLLGDVARGEDGLEVLPHGLHLHPALELLADVAQLDDPLLHLLLEGDHVARCHDRAEIHLRLLERLHELARRAAVEHDVAAALEGREGEALRGPVEVELLELGLDGELLDGRVGDVLNVLCHLEHARVEQRAQLEGVARRVELLAREHLQAVPVPVTHGRVREHVHEGQALEEVVDSLLELDEGVPRAEVLGHALARPLEVLHLLGHHLHVLRLADVGPVEVVVVGHRREHVGVEAVELVEQLELLLGLVEVGVLGDGQAEELLARVVRLVLARALLVEALELLEALARLERRQAGHVGPVSLEVVAELDHVDVEHLDVAHEALAESRLHVAQLVGDRVGELLELGPLVHKVTHRVELLLGHGDAVEGEHRVLVLHGLELPVEHGLLLADLGEVLHGKAHVVEVVDVALEVAVHLLHPVRDAVQLLLGLAVKVLAVLVLPRRRLALERHLEGRRVEGERADDVPLGDALDLVLDHDVTLDLGVVVLERRVLLHEGLVGFAHVVLPQVVVLGEGAQVLEDLALGALDGAREQQHGAHHLAVVRDHLVDALLLLARGRLPQLQALATVEHRARGAVERALDVGERRVHQHVGQLQLDAHVEEGLADDGGGGARADACLDEVEAVLRALEHGRVHARAEVEAQLGHVLLLDALARVREGVARDERDEVDDGHLDLLVLGRHELGLHLDVLLLHLHELVEGEGVVVLRHVHQLERGDEREVAREPVLDDVADLDDHVVEAAQLGVEGRQVGLDVHARPGEAEHTWS